MSKTDQTRNLSNTHGMRECVCVCVCTAVNYPPQP